MGTWPGQHLNGLLLEGYPDLFVFVPPTQDRIHREGGNWSLIWFRSCVCPNGSFTLGPSAKIIFLKFRILNFPFHQLTLWANLLRNWVFLKKLASFARQFCTSLLLGPLSQPIWRGTLWRAPDTFGFSLRGCLPLSPFQYNSPIPQGFRALHLGKEYAYCSLHLLSAFERVNHPRPPPEPHLKLFLHEFHYKGLPPFSPVSLRYLSIKATFKETRNCTVWQYWAFQEWWCQWYLSYKALRQGPCRVHPSPSWSERQITFVNMGEATLSQQF